MEILGHPQFRPYRVAASPDATARCLRRFYVLADRTIWAPRCTSDKVIGLAAPPVDEQGFIKFSNAVIRSKRMLPSLRT
jgi:hypothetical protein